MDFFMSGEIFVIEGSLTIRNQIIFLKLIQISEIPITPMGRSLGYGK